MINIPSPAVAIVGRHNSGKTTLVEKLIAELVERGLDVGSVKHHSHKGFDIDHPGKDSYRHRAAGASETVIAAPGQMARIKTIEGEVECRDIVRSMPGHDIVLVEGYRKSGLPTIEIMRSGNPADVAVAQAFAQGAKSGASLGTDFIQTSRGQEAFRADLDSKMPRSNTVAIVTDIPQAEEAADIYGIPVFGFDDVANVADFLQETYTRHCVSVVIQAGGESRRMGRSKATVPFRGNPLISRLVARLAPVADELIVTTNEAENLQFLQEEFPYLDIRLVPDVHEQRGALRGLNTAFSAARFPYVAVVACDMVFASPSLVVAEAMRMSETKADIVVPVNQYGFEPFHALYRRSACLEASNRALAQGRVRAQDLFDGQGLDVVEFSREEVIEVEPRGGCFINVNTPEDLKRVEETFLGE